MRARIKGNARIWDDVDQLNPLMALDDALSEIVVDGYLEQSSGRSRILGAGAPFTIPFGTVAAPRCFMLRVIGATGANLAVNGGTARQIRPPTTVAGPTTTTPTGLYLETSGDLVSLVVSNPDATAAVDFIWVLFGDPAP